MVPVSAPAVFCRLYSPLKFLVAILVGFVVEFVAKYSGVPTTYPPFPNFVGEEFLSYELAC